MPISPSRLWHRFRGLPRWAQVSTWVVLGIAALAPFGEDDEESRVEAGRGPETAPAPTTTEMRPEPAITTTSASVPTTVPPGVPASGDDTIVVRVVDGDTLEVSGGTRVRLIGVDAPETSGACFGPEATRYATELVPPGTPVRLVYDRERLDQYGRTLAYVYKLTDGVFVNQAVARNGFATQLTVGDNVAHAETFRRAVSEARTASLGLWRLCLTTTTPAPVPLVPAPRATVAPTTPAAGGGCHPSYSGACVPTGFSDVDCASGSGNGPGYVSGSNFRVVGPDVYDLDGNDNDGVACESR